MKNIIRLYYDVKIIISYNNLEKEGIFIIRNIKEDRLMKKKLSLLLATIMVVNAVSTMAFAWENPLKKYNLYEDVTGGGSGNAEAERAMEEYNSNSLRPASVPSQNLNTSSSSDYDLNSLSSQTEAEVKGRNETLRESSRNVYVILNLFLVGKLVLLSIQIRLLKASEKNITEAILQDVFKNVFLK